MTLEIDARAMTRSYGTHTDEELAQARTIALQVVERYGDDDEHALERMRRNGIWSDHPAVQAALVTLRLAKAGKLEGAQSARIADLEAQLAGARAGLTEIAAFDDEGANRHLENTGSYSRFDEPNAALCARATLGEPFAAAIRSRAAGEKGEG